MTTQSNNFAEGDVANGAAWAAMLAAAIGCFAFGAAVDLAAAFPAVSRLLNFYSPSGDLSGKSTTAIVVWAAAWGVLSARWKTRNIRTRPVMITTLLLIFLALLATFPPFFGLL